MGHDLKYGLPHPPYGLKPTAKVAAFCIKWLPKYGGDMNNSEIRQLCEIQRIGNNKNSKDKNANDVKTKL